MAVGGEPMPGVNGTAAAPFMTVLHAGAGTVMSGGDGQALVSTAPSVVPRASAPPAPPLPPAPAASGPAGESAPPQAEAAAASSSATSGARSSRMSPAYPRRGRAARLTGAGRGGKRDAAMTSEIGDRLPLLADLLMDAAYADKRLAGEE